MRTSNYAYFMKKYYPKSADIVFASLRKNGFNLTDQIFKKKGDQVIDLRINFSY